jgi:hypothetical protein
VGEANCRPSCGRQDKTTPDSLAHSLTIPRGVIVINQSQLIPECRRETVALTEQGDTHATIIIPNLSNGRKSTPLRPNAGPQRPRHNDIIENTVLTEAVVTVGMCAVAVLASNKRLLACWPRVTRSPAVGELSRIVVPVTSIDAYGYSLDCRL